MKYWNRCACERWKKEEHRICGLCADRILEAQYRSACRSVDEADRALWEALQRRKRRKVSVAAPVEIVAPKPQESFWSKLWRWIKGLFR